MSDCSLRVIAAIAALVCATFIRAESLRDAGYVDSATEDASLVLILKIYTKEHGEILGEEFHYRKITPHNDPFPPFVAQAGGGYGDGDGMNYFASLTVDSSSSPPRLRLYYRRIEHRPKRTFKVKRTFDIPVLEDFSIEKSGVRAEGKWVAKEPNQALQPTPMLVTPRADARVAPSTGVADL